MCCFWCRALAWTYEGDSPESAEFLYTNFGRQAAHRETLHRLNSSTFHLSITFAVYSTSLGFPNTSLFDTFMFEVAKWHPCVNATCPTKVGYKRWMDDHLWSITNLRNPWLGPLAILGFILCPTIFHIFPEISIFPSTFGGFWFEKFNISWNISPPRNPTGWNALGESGNWAGYNCILLIGLDGWLHICRWNFTW